MDTAGAASGPSLLGGIPLSLVEATKAIDFGPAKIELGSIRLHPWQVHPLSLSTSDSHRAYLVKLNFELDLRPGVPPPAWMEVGFEFMLDEVSVGDALPRSSDTRQPAGMYALTPHLSLAPQELVAAQLGGVASGIAQPQVDTPVETFGVGGAAVRWRYRSAGETEVRPGSYTCWVVLEVPADQEKLPVVASGQYHLGSRIPKDLRPADRSDAFIIALPGPPAAKAAPAAVSDPSGVDRPRVFVSYAHDDEGHKQAVQELCDLLVRCGVDVRMDQWELHIRRDWRRWITTQVRRADFVLVVGSPDYRVAAEEEVPAARNRGVRSEVALLAEYLHQDRDVWTPRILPVILPGRDVEDIPLLFQPFNADHYRVSAITREGVDELLQVINRSPGRRPPEDRLAV